MNSQKEMGTLAWPLEGQQDLRSRRGRVGVGVEHGHDFMEETGYVTQHQTRLVHTVLSYPLSHLTYISIPYKYSPALARSGCKSALLSRIHKLFFRILK